MLALDTRYFVHFISGIPALLRYDEEAGVSLETYRSRCSFLWTSISDCSVWLGCHRFRRRLERFGPFHHRAYLLTPRAIDIWDLIKVRTIRTKDLDNPTGYKAPMKMGPIYNVRRLAEALRQRAEAVDVNPVVHAATPIG